MGFHPKLFAYDGFMLSIKQEVRFLLLPVVGVSLTIIILDVCAPSIGYFPVIYRIIKGFLHKR